VTVAEGILVGGEGAHYTWSDNGLLAYVAGRGNYEDRTLVWVDRTGKSASVNAPRRPYQVPRLSPDGLQVAVMIAGATQDTWVLNLARGREATSSLSGHRTESGWCTGQPAPVREISSGEWPTAVERKSD
jgi:hypothetical protein